MTDVSMSLPQISKLIHHYVNFTCNAQIKNACQARDYCGL